jgi:hypothetical protein
MPGVHHRALLFCRVGKAACGIASSFSLTGCLPVSASPHLPAFSMQLRKMPQSLACIIAATPINSPAT